MTDKELLELAAKAIGETLKFFRYAPDYNDREIGIRTIDGEVPYLGELPNGWDIPDGYWKAWNPLTNKADLWDLAMKCRLLIDFSEGYVTCFQEDHYFTVGNQQEAAEAVVLAAAEIWRNRK